MTQDKIRNVAIIAHIDHGKTTLVDGLLRQSGVFRPDQKVADRVMDSNALERERGITILSKNTSVQYLDYWLNIVDTPGHVDFSGEVERILGMVDGCLLIVDAAEGPMAQTRFVVQKALAVGLVPILVVNKIDRPDSRVAAVVDEVLELFIALDATDDQIDFPIVYASARDQVASLTPDGELKDLKPIFDLIVEHVPPPQGHPDKPLQMMVASLDYDDYIGRLAVGRVLAGQLERHRQVAFGSPEEEAKRGKISRLYLFEGLERKEVESVGVGQIALVAGLTEIAIGDTITDPENPNFLPGIKVDEPTLAMTFLTSDSPLAGRDGKYVTSRHLAARLNKEIERNVALRVEPTDTPDVFDVCGRGELHLSILLETMRREGYELSVSSPRVVVKKIDGVTQEPIERLVLDIPEDSMGAGHGETGRASSRPAGHAGFRKWSATTGILDTDARSDRLPFRVLDPDPRLRRDEPPFGRLRSPSGRSPEASEGLPDRLGGGLGHHLRPSRLTRPRGVLHRAGRRGLSRHGGGRTLPPQRPGSERLQKEAGDQHP